MGMLQCKAGWPSRFLDAAVRKHLLPLGGQPACSQLPAAGVPVQAPLGASEGLRLWNLQKVLSFWGYSKRVCVCWREGRKEAADWSRQHALLPARNGCPESEWKE